MLCAACRCLCLCTRLLVAACHQAHVALPAAAERANEHPPLLIPTRCRLATFYSRSRKGRWCKGETSGHFIKVGGRVCWLRGRPWQAQAARAPLRSMLPASRPVNINVSVLDPSPLPPQVLSAYMDCDRDSLIYLSDPIGPACHTNAPTCYFTQLDASSGAMRTAGDHHSKQHAPMTTLFALERTIEQRRAEAEAGTAAGVRGTDGAGVGENEGWAVLTLLHIASL